MSVDPPYNVYRDQLTSLYHGLPLWNPNPLKTIYNHVSIGDVGYVHEGVFIRMFNVILPWDHESNRTLGKPEPYESLDCGPFPTVLDVPLKTQERYSRNVSAETNDSNARANAPDDAEGVTYNCRGHGALLFLPHGGRRTDNTHTKVFEDYIRDHVASWFTWAQKNRRGVERMEDLILVSGCTLVSSWAAAAFVYNTKEARISLARRTFNNGGECFVWGNIRGDVEYHDSDINPQNPPTTLDQCVFIRGFRAKRVLFRTKPMRAAAEPRPDDPDNRRDDEIQVTRVPDGPKYRDPLIAILDYIEERCSKDTQAEDTIAIAHDDDLRLIKHVEILTADAIEEFLREKQMPLLIENGAAILRDFPTRQATVERREDQSQKETRPSSFYRLAKVASTSFHRLRDRQPTTAQFGSLLAEIHEPRLQAEAQNQLQQRFSRLGFVSPSKTVSADRCSTANSGLPLIPAGNQYTSPVVQYPPTPSLPLSTGAIDPTGLIDNQIPNVLSHPLPLPILHQYTLKSNAFIIIKSHALDTQDPPLLYFGEDITGYVLSHLSDIQRVDVVLQVFNLNLVNPSFEVKHTLSSQQVDQSQFPGGTICWPFTIAPPTDSIVSSSSSADSTIGHQSFNGHSAGGELKVELIVTGHRSGPLTRKVGVKQKIFYVLRPDPSPRPQRPLRLSPAQISVSLPGDVAPTPAPPMPSWPQQKFPTVTMRGVIFGRVSVEVECKLITPSEYPANDRIPLRLVLTSESYEALDLFAMSHVIDVRLQKVIAFGDRAGVARPLTLKDRGSFHRKELAARANWLRDGDIRALPPDEHHRRPRWRVKLNGTLQRIGGVELIPSYEEPGVAMAIMYFVSFFPFHTPEFLPAKDPKKELVIGKIKLTGPSQK